MNDELPRIMARAAAVAAASTLRYGQALAIVAVRHQAALAQAMGGPPTPGGDVSPRVLADELRGCFREVGEAACEEARRLALELDAVSEELARVAEAAGPGGPYRRPHKAKE